MHVDSKLRNTLHATDIIGIMGLMGGVTIKSNDGCDEHI